MADKDLHLRVWPRRAGKTKAMADALARLQAAEARYLELASGALNCPAWWEFDPPGPDYVGTRCALLEGHDGRHRAGPIEWPNP